MRKQRCELLCLFIGCYSLLFMTNPSSAGNKAGATKNSTSTPSNEAVVSPPSRSDQTRIIASARQYTERWIKHDYANMLPLLSRRCPEYQWGSKKLIEFMRRQREMPPYQVAVSARSEDMHVISSTRSFLIEVLGAALTEDELRRLLSGQWPNWSRPDVALISFDLQKRHYLQLWGRDEDGVWRCLHLPLDLDSGLVQKINAGLQSASAGSRSETEEASFLQHFGTYGKGHDNQRRRRTDLYSRKGNDPANNKGPLSK